VDRINGVSDWTRDATKGPFVVISVPDPQDYRKFSGPAGIPEYGCILNLSAKQGDTGRQPHSTPVPSVPVRFSRTHPDCPESHPETL